MAENKATIKELAGQLAQQGYCVVPQGTRHGHAAIATKAFWRHRTITHPEG